MGVVLTRHGSFDLETCRFRPGLPFPPYVCATWATGGAVCLATTAETEELAAEVWGDESQYVVGANIAYDALVLMQWAPRLREIIKRAYAQGRVICLSRFERMLQIAAGEPRGDNRLAALSLRHGGPKLNKDDGTQTSYGPLWQRPLSEYAPLQIHYACHDTLAGDIVFERQLARARRIGLPLPVVALETQDALWQSQIVGWGIRTEAVAFAELEARALARLDALGLLAQAQGFLREDGTQDQDAIRRAVTEAYEGSPPMTEPVRDYDRKKQLRFEKHTAALRQALAEGNTRQAKASLRYALAAAPDVTFQPRVSIAKTVLIGSDDPRLITLADWGSARSLVNKDLTMLRAGLDWPIHAMFEVADTLRTILKKPNLQNFGRDGGVRECVHPRDGYALVSWDIGGMELGTLAQVVLWVLGDRRMCDEINSGVDLHTKIAALIMDVAYEEALRLVEAGDSDADHSRGCGKVGNFGFPGGMAVETLVWYAKQSYGITITLEQAQRIYDAWRRARPEVVAYLKWARRKRRGDGRYAYEIPMSGGLVRANTTYCATCNGHFQGLGAIMAKAIARAAVPQCYEPDSPLHRTRFGNFVHDELLAEVPLERVQIVVPYVEGIFQSGFATYCPDVKLTTKGVPMRYWSKSAKQRRHHVTKELVRWPVWTDVVDLAFKAGGGKPKAVDADFTERKAEREAAIAATVAGGVLTVYAPRKWDAAAADRVLQSHATRYGISHEQPYGD